ncbi:MAG: hypothetical protein AAF449_12725, partial [Myxococcota bacterium]
IDRRALLRGFAALGIGTATTACSSSESPQVVPDAGIPTDGGIEPQTTLFDVYRELRSALRGSPDHLPARADTLVAAGDISKIFDFVRDEIAVYPTRFNVMDDAPGLQLFGVRATLRGGAGSPRDKVEVLRILLEQAGITSQVVQGRLRSELQDLQSIINRKIERRLIPDVEANRILRWLQVAGITPSASVPPLGIPNETTAQTVADAIIDLIPEQNFIGPDFDWRWSARVPLLSFTFNGQEIFACPIVPTATFGDSCVEQVEPLQTPPQIDEVEVSLEAMTSLEPNRRLELVKGTWSGSNITGRQLVISCHPAMSVAERLRTAFHQAPFYIPVLGLQTIEASPTEGASVVGRPFTVGGTRLDIVDDGSIAVDATILNGDERLPTGSAQDVDAISIEVDAGRFDAISVKVTLRDPQGANIEGLPAEALRVTEDGQDVPFLLTRNRADPRIVVIIDQSSSMPTIWRGTEQVDAFVAELATAVQDVYPRAQIVLDTVGDSNVWKNLARISHRNPTSTVYVTDGDISDQRTPEIESALLSSPPALLVYVKEGSPPRSELTEMATLTQGAVIAANMQTTAAEMVLDFVREQSIAPYVLSYRAPREGPTQRRVEVRVPAAERSSGQNYAVPTASEPARLIGIYLTVTIGENTVTRTLAGVHHDRRGNEPAPLDSADEVASFLAGDHVLAFEGATPTASVWLDDVLSGRLAMEPIIEAATTGDDRALIDTLEMGAPLIPGELGVVLPPLWPMTKDTVSYFETGIRAVLFSEGPRFGTQQFIRKVDMLPFGLPAAATIESNARIRETIRVGIRSALQEARILETSTAALLNNAPLTYIGVGRTSFYAEQENLSPEVRTRWRQLLFEQRDNIAVGPTDGTRIALWSIERRSGRTLGVLGDGSGGAATYVATIELLEEVMALGEYLNLAARGFQSAGAVGRWQDQGSRRASNVCDHYWQD